MDNLLLDYASDSGITNSYQTEYERMLSNYRLYNNFIDQKDLERECNPLGLEVGQYRDEVQPYNKTYNKIQVLLGDELRRPFDLRAVLTNSDGVKSKLAHKDTLLRNFVMSKIQSLLQELGVNQEQEFDPNTLIDPADVDQYMATSYLDAKEILANKLLSYLIKELSIKDLKNDAFKHGLISGQEVVYVGMNHDQPLLEVLNPLGVFYHKSPEIKYIQDSLYAGYRTYMTSGDLLDKFGAYLSEEDLNRIDESREGLFNYGESHINSTMKYYQDDNFYASKMFGSQQEGSYGSSEHSNDNWLVQHVEWKSQKRVGFIKYVNQFGDTEVTIVSEEFEPPVFAEKIVNTVMYGKKETSYIWKDEEGITYSLTWGWIPEVWSGVRISDDIYCMMGPKQYQFRHIDNPYKVKLGYHGITFSAMNANPVSLMDRMKPFQYLYFIVMHKLKKFIAQDKGRIFHFDTSMVDPKLGLEKTLYYLTNMNIDFYNPLQNAQEPGQAQRGKVTGSTEMSMADQVMNYVNILAALDDQISDVAGVNRQREGQVNPAEAVTNAQSNIAMSAVITEVYFQAHHKLWEEVLTSLIDVATQCYKEKGLVKQYVLDDMSIQTLSFTPDMLSNASFGIFISNSAKDQEVFQTLQQLSQALVQNDKIQLRDLVKMLKSNSIAELETQLIQAEARNMEQYQQQMQMQQQADMERLQAEQEFELQKIQLEIDGKIAVAEINSFARQMDQDVNDNLVPDQLEIEKLRTDKELKTRKLNLDEKKLAQDAKFKEEELQIKRKQANRAIKK